MEYTTIQLPEYLPTQFKNWLEFYVFLQEEFKKLGVIPGDDYEVNMHESKRNTEVKELNY